jgi:hypothetical protein
MSASIKPTFAPCLLKPIAKFTATVDFPTPPLPEATSMMFLILGKLFNPSF